MSRQNRETVSSSTPRTLPEKPNLEWLRKYARQHLKELQESAPASKLADAQLAVARQFGFKNWRALKAHIDSLTVDGRLIDAARQGHAALLATMLDRHPEKLHLRIPPYEWTLLHLAAQHGRLEVVDLLLRRGLDVNTREKGDNTYAMHWAAAGGHLEVVKRLADAGGDIIGHGDDHDLEVIGWATGWDGCDDESHRAVAEFLIGRGARHHIFSAIAADLPEEVTRLVTADLSVLTRRMSSFEDEQTPLHYAVNRGKLRMVDLPMQFGADPLAVDSSGFTAIARSTSTEIDKPVMRAIDAIAVADMAGESKRLDSASLQSTGLVASLAMRDLELAERLVRRNPGVVGGGPLHLMAKRGDPEAAAWLIDHGADPNERWAHWDSEVTPLHMAIMTNHAEVVRLLLERGTDPRIPDTKHTSDALGWAEFFRRETMAEMIRSAAQS